MVDQKRINKHLKQHWDTINLKGFHDNQIVGIFLYGSQNYNLATDDSNIDTKAIVIPTLDDICTKPQWISTTYACNSKELCDVEDIREIKHQWMKQNNNFIEILFTDYYILNPKYANTFNLYFRDNADKIAYYNKTQMIKSICNQILHTLHESMDNKKLYHCHRLLYLLNQYLNDKPYKQCIQPSGTDWINLWQLKYGESELSRNKTQRQKDTRTLEITIQNLLDTLITYNADQEIKQIMNDGVKEILCINLGDLRCATISADGFKSELTNLEKQAYQALIKQIHDEGRISITAFSKEIGIGKVTITNLLNKMEQKQVAKIQRNPPGSKQGTFISITEPELKQEAKNIQ